ncbi:MAG: hypothetical protein ACRDLN_07945 [Solirubrobacteraceae bacterium]
MSVIATILASAEHAAEGAAEGGAHAGEEHKSELPFFLLGGLLAGFAIVISIVGFKRPDFPAGDGAARGVMALSVTLVIAAMVSIVYVSA